MTRTRDREPALPPGFFYVNQDNYCLVRTRSSPHRYLYADGATSCLILILQGRDAAGDDIALLTHISEPRRIDALFRLVTATFVGPVAVWAQGANPPSAEASVVNARIMMRWLSDHARRERAAGEPEPPWFFDRVHLAIGQGDPIEQELHAFGIDLDRGVVSNRAVPLTLAQRDPTGGMQALFSVFGHQLVPRMLLWDAEQPMPWPLQCSLVNAARKAHWGRIARMSDEDICFACSTTPTCELPWFPQTLRTSAELVERFDTYREPPP
ncbi:MAG TPA: hypothetical protein VNM90_13965 [Haliangium sp.]|nr:hypothetical protein [Haliangium sp.]